MKVLIAGAPGEVVSLLVSACEEKGFQIEKVEDHRAVTQFAECGQADLVCFAHYLAEGTSFDACKYLRQTSKWQKTPIVLVMERSSQLVIEKAFSSGFSETFELNHKAALLNFLSYFNLAKTPQRGRILVVEDSVVQQKVVTEILSSRGFEVHCCLNASSALNLMGEEDFDLLLTDIVLEGGTTGLELISFVRQLPEGKGDIPIIVMSSHSESSQKISPFRIGADDYISKPIDSEELLVRATRLIKAWHLSLKVKEQQQKLESANTFMSQMLGRVSHECRNSINIVMGVSKMMLRRESFNDSQQAKLETIVNASRHQLSLLDDILDYTKLESGNIELNVQQANLQDLLEEVVSLFRYTCEERGLVLECNLDERLPKNIALDRRLVKQVLINLLNNAVKFTQEGFIRLKIELAEKELIFSVADSGPGIPEEERQLLFEEFKQTNVGKNRESSSGLGLSLCKGFAEVMKGRMDVESAVGEGSCFKLVIPFSA